MARLQSTSQQFKVAMQETLEETHAILVATAKREHAKIMAAEPQPSTFIRIVDGQRGLPEEAVRPAGVIVYRYPRLEQVVQFAMETLFDLSPVLSGEYRNAHTLFVNGQEVSNLAGYKPGDDIAITNYVPYSRKIEVGKMKMRVPGSDRVYQQARRRVMSRYGNLANIRFTYRGIVGGRQVNASVKPSGRSHNRAELRFPVLEISER